MTQRAQWQLLGHRLHSGLPDESGAWRPDFGPPGDLVRANFSAEGERFYFHDALGSTTLLAGFPTPGSTPQVAALYDYDPWGNQLTTPQPALNRVNFTTYRHDTETGLEYAMARYYNSARGLLLQADPVADGLSFRSAGVSVEPLEASRQAVAKMPVGASPYYYAENNPLTVFDPDGRRPRLGKDIRVQAVLLSDPVLWAIMVNAVNYSPAKFEENLLAGEFKNNGRGDLPWTRLIGLAGEAVMMESVIRRGITWAVPSPKVAIHGEEYESEDKTYPDLMSGMVGGLPIGTVEGVLAGPEGPTVTVRFAAPKFFGFYEVKTCSTLQSARRHYREGAFQVASPSFLMACTGFVYVLVVDHDMWFALPLGTRTKVFDTVNAAAGYIYLLRGLNAQAVQRAERLVTEATAAISLPIQP